MSKRLPAYYVQLFYSLVSQFIKGMASARDKPTPGRPAEEVTPKKSILSTINLRCTHEDTMDPWLSTDSLRKHAYSNI